MDTAPQSNQTNMDPRTLAFIALAIGLFLLVIEFFIPSGGVIFMIAALSLVVGLWGAWQAWWTDSPGYFWTYLGSMVVLAPASVAGGLYALQKTPLGNRILLKAPTKEEVTVSYSDPLEGLVGKSGETVGLLNPGGMVLVDGNRYHCESQGMMIDPKTLVEVIGVQGSRLVVRTPVAQLSEATKDEEVAEEKQETESIANSFDDMVSTDENSASTKDNSIDFDIPTD